MQERTGIDLAKGPVGRLVLKIALPTVAAQAVNMLYNIVDRMFIGRIEGIGTVALAGVGVCLPVIILIMALSLLIGAGGAPKSAIELGKNNRDGAEKILGACVVPLLVVSALVTVIILRFGRQMLPAFGATEASLPYAWNYLRIIGIGSVFSILTTGLNPFINTQGKTLIGMMSVIIGAVLNVALDAVFVLGLKMGVEGAAVATVISQGVSCAWVTGYLISKKSTLRIKREHLLPNPKMVGGILLLGIAPFLMTAMESLVTIVLNFVLKRYGAAEFAGFETDGATLAISVGAIVTMASSFILMPIGGFAQGLQPVIGYNFGAGRHDRVKKAIVFAAAVCTGYAAVLYAFFMFAPAGFVALFTTDAVVIRVSSVFLRIYVSGMLLFGPQCILQNSFAARGSAVNAIIIALIRKAVYIPLMFILPLIFGAAKGVTAAYIASPIADVLAAAFTIVLFFRTYKDIMNGGEAVSAKPKWSLIPATLDYAALASSVSLTFGICGITVILLSIFTGISDLLPLQIMFICAGAFLCVMAQPAYKKIGDKDPAQAAGVIEW